MIRKSIYGVIALGLAVVLLGGWTAVKVKSRDAGQWVREQVICVEDDIRVAEEKVTDLEPCLKSAYVKMRLNEDRAKDAAKQASETRAVMEKAEREIKTLAAQAKDESKKVIKVGPTEHTRQEVLDDLNVRLDDYEQLQTRAAHEEAILTNIQATHANSQTAYESMKAQRQEMVRTVETARTKAERIRSQSPQAVVDRESARFAKVQKDLKRIDARLKKAGLEAEWAAEAKKQLGAQERITRDGYQTSFEKTKSRDPLVRVQAMFGDKG